jgi:hypothetical protein
MCGRKDRGKGAEVQWDLEGNHEVPEKSPIINLPIINRSALREDLKEIAALASMRDSFGRMPDWQFPPPFPSLCAAGD